MKNIALFLLLLLKISIYYGQTAESAYKAGMLLKENKKSKDAIVEFKKAIQLDPRSYKSMYELGWCYNDTKDYKLALEYLKKVRPHWNSIPKVFFELGYAFEQTNQKDSAKENYHRCLTLKPDYKLAYKQLAYISYDDSKNEDFLLLIKKYLSLDSTGGNSYLVFYRKGFLENVMKQYNDAIVSLNKAVKLKTDYVNTYLELGFAHTKLKQGLLAIYNFKEANKIDINSHIPYNGIAEVYRDVYKKVDSAIYWYKETLKVKPKERKASFGIGYCMNTQGQHTSAEPYLKQAIEQEPTYTAAYIELGYAYFKLKQYAKAETNLKKAIQLSADSHNAHYYLCQLYIEQKNKTAAISEVSELEKLNSKYVEELTKKAKAL